MPEIQIQPSRWCLERCIIVFIMMLMSTIILSSSAMMKYPPKIVRQPLANQELLFQDGQTENEKPFTIECEAEGIPPPKYTWHKDGKPYNVDGIIMQQLRQGTLLINSPTESDSGQYQCLATNELGVATSNSVFVIKYEFYNFNDEDTTTITADENQPASLTCHPPHSYPKADILWIKQANKGHHGETIDSNRITVDPEGTLWFSYITRDDQSNDFTYTCSIKSIFGNEYKLGSRVFLKVNKLDSSSSVSKVEKEPKEQFVSRNNTIILKEKTLELWCIFSGIPLPEIKWIKKNGILPADRIYYKNYGKTLEIKNVTYDDEGTYECEATNGFGTPLSHTMNVEVQSIPYFTVEPEIQNITDGEIADFKCEANGLPHPKIIWTYNGLPIEEKLNKSNMEITTNMIRIFNLSKADTGNYGCNATNENGYVYKDVYLNVLAFSPEIVVPPIYLLTVDGTDVNMTCRVFGIPRPEVTWVRDGMELTGQRYNISDDGDLVIKDVNLSDSGNYTCRAVNKFGNQTGNGSLEVKRRTKITDPSMDYKVTAGSNVTFRCNVVSDESLKLSIDWMFENRAIDFDREPRIVKKSDNSLNIINTTLCDSGTYTCHASTELDETRILGTLIVRDFEDSDILNANTTLGEGSARPGKPSFSWGHASTKTGDSAINITLIPDETNPGAFFFVQYRRCGESAFVDSRYEFNEDFLILNGLDLNQMYEVRVVAVNGHYCTTSDTEKIETSAAVVTNKALAVVTQREAPLSSTTEGWLIGVMVTIVLCVHILIIICVIKRKLCRSYTLPECEIAQSKEFYSGGGFTEYSQSFDGPSIDSSSSYVKRLIESDTSSCDVKPMIESDTSSSDVKRLIESDTSSSDVKRLIESDTDSTVEIGKVCTGEASCNGISFVV